MSSVKELKERRNAALASMEPLIEKIERGERLTTEDRDAFDQEDRAVKDLDKAIAALESYQGNTREAESGGYEVRGDPNEPVPAGRMREWYRKAQENGVRDEHGRPLSSHGKDFDLNAYWGQRMGFAKPGAEIRALAEDTPGSAQAIAPQSWESTFVDVLLPATWAGALGFRNVMMDNETVNVPVFTSTVSPAWIAEGGNISLDANPAFTTLKLFAPGGIKDVTQFSIELAQDAFIQGNLDQMLAEAVGKKMAVVVDTASLSGIATNTGVPGLNGETGFVIRHYAADGGTAGIAPTDTTELGVVAELTKKLNVQPNGFLSNLGCQQAIHRIPVTSFGRYWEDPSITAGMDWVTSENSALPYVETDPATASAVAQSGGSFTSLYCGPWNQFAMIGWRQELRTRVLTERYIDAGELALFSYLRLSIRYAHPETFSRTIGIKPV